MALATTVVWNIRIDGDDTNGGGFNAARGGTDYTLQAAAQATGTVTSVTTTVTATTSIFTSAMVGNLISDGTTWKEITAFSSATVVTVDSAPSWTAAAIKVGGALLSPGKWASITQSGTGSQKAIANIRAGTYLLSNSSNVSGGKIACTATQTLLRGYATTPGDSGTAPVLTANANNVTCVAISGNDQSFENLVLDGATASFSGTVGVSGSSRSEFRSVTVRNTRGIGFSQTATMMLWCVGDNCQVGIQGSGAYYGCIVRNSTGYGIRPSGASVIFVGCISYSNSGAGWNGQFPMYCVGCVAYGNGASGFDFTAQLVGTLVNCIAYGNTGNGWLTNTATSTVILYNCAGGSNSSGDFNSTDIPATNKIGQIVLTADPFVAKASANFALNTTAGGGALLRGAGYGAFPGGAMVGYPDVGAAQHQDAGGAPFSRLRPGR